VAQVEPNNFEKAFVDEDLSLPWRKAKPIHKK